MKKNLFFIFALLTKLNLLLRSSLEAGKSAERSVLGDDLDVNTIWDDLLLLIESVVVRLDEVSETEFSGDEDLLSTWELEL